MYLPRIMASIGLVSTVSHFMIIEKLQTVLSFPFNCFFRCWFLNHGQSTSLTEYLKKTLVKTKSGLVQAYTRHVSMNRCGMESYVQRY
jgi:hypothetical protein